MNNSDELAVKLGEVLSNTGLMLATAESCTGGMIAARVTDVAGSSGWFECAFITYSNDAKCQMLGVHRDVIDAHGAVSEEVVHQMAEGALARSTAQVSVAVSGVAGPDGGSEDKPVGTVWFAWGYGSGSIVTEKRCFDGDRAAVREQTVCHALQCIIQRLQL
ncbi:MAG: CinA family protein [Pseudomonadota bacterium]